MTSKEISYEIVEHIGIISENPNTKWKMELNLVAWNGKQAKYDVRDWDEEHKLMSRGITFNRDEAKVFCDLLQQEFSLDETLHDMVATS